MVFGAVLVTTPLCKVDALQVPSTQMPVTGSAYDYVIPKEQEGYSDSSIALSDARLQIQLQAAPEDVGDGELCLNDMDRLMHNLGGGTYRKESALGVVFLLSNSEDGSFTIRDGGVDAQWVTLIADHSVQPDGSEGVVLRKQNGDLIEMPREEFLNKRGLVTAIELEKDQKEFVIVTDISIISKFHLFDIGQFVEYLDSAGDKHRVSPSKFNTSWDNYVYGPVKATEETVEEVISPETTQQPEITEIIPSDETLEQIPEFGLVTDGQIIDMLGDTKRVKEWPPVVYVRDSNGRFFDPETAALVGEFGHIEINPEENYLIRLVTPTRVSSWVMASELLSTQQVGFLTALTQKDGKKNYVVITNMNWRDSILEDLMSSWFGHRSSWCLEYVDKSNKVKKKYLDLFTTKLGWNHIFYQPKSQE